MNNKPNEEFSPPKSKKTNFLTNSTAATSSNNNAWSDPVKSVNLVKFPKQNPNNITVMKEESKVKDYSMSKAWTDPTKSIQLASGSDKVG